MSTARGVVVDTNVVVSGLLTRDPTAPTARILEAMLAGRFPFLLSIDLLAEYREVLLRPRVRRGHGLEDTAVDAILARLAQHAAIRDPVATDERAPDRGDQHLWALLAAAPGAMLVTGDQALAERPPRGVTVLSPAEFVKLLDD
jgi:putative PIN family toxin of toxin-antitoxin system